MRRAAITALIGFSIVIGGGLPANAVDKDPNVTPATDAYQVHYDSDQQLPKGPGNSGSTSNVLNAVPAPSSPNADLGACGAASTINPDACAPPPGDPAAPPVVGGDEALRALQQIDLPLLASQTQPTDKTLVNFDTIFYVDAAQFQRTVTLLGQQVTLDITPSSFTWNHGDGTTNTTTRAGAKYPSKDIVHRYPKAHTTVAHSVTIVWSAWFQVGAGPWQAVPGTVTTTGPPTNLRIAEATPVLTGQR